MRGLLALNHWLVMSGEKKETRRPDVLILVFHAANTDMDPGVEDDLPKILSHTP